MSVEKRKRSMNFSIEEKMRFLRILQKKGHVIISKVAAHDLQTNRLKEVAWTEIRNELNASGSILRTTDNLKKLWQKMKTEAKRLEHNQMYGIEEGSSKSMGDPVLGIVSEMTGRGSSGTEFIDCDSELMMYTLNASTLDGNSESAISPSTRLDPEQSKTPPSAPPIVVVKERVSPSDEEASNLEVLYEKIPVEYVKHRVSHSDEEVSNLEVFEEKKTAEYMTPTSQSNSKRCRPMHRNNERQNTKSVRVSLDNSIASERLRSEKEKRALIRLQRQHMTEEHALKLKHAELKTKILEAVLKKIEDEKSVDPELVKVVTNM